jgi:hypothetical protein
MAPGEHQRVGGTKLRDVRRLYRELLKDIMREGWEDYEIVGLGRSEVMKFIEPEKGRGAIAGIGIWNTEGNYWEVIYVLYDTGEIVPVIFVP